MDGEKPCARSQDAAGWIALPVQNSGVFCLLSGELAFGG
jgi:hypothetical protein